MASKYWHSACRRRSLIVVEKAKPKLKKVARLKEAAGEAAAECAAVVCCWPCGLANLLVVAVIKLPAKLVRRAIQQMKRKDARHKGRRKDDHADFGVHGGRGFLWAGTAAAEEEVKEGEEEAWPPKTLSQEMLELEKQMQAMFYGAGFWRSPSQKGIMLQSASRKVKPPPPIAVWQTDF